MRMRSSPGPAPPAQAPSALVQRRALHHFIRLQAMPLHTSRRAVVLDAREARLRERVARRVDRVLLAAIHPRAALRRRRCDERVARGVRRAFHRLRAAALLLARDARRVRGRCRADRRGSRGPARARAARARRRTTRARCRRRSRARRVALREGARVERAERGVVLQAGVARPVLHARRSARRASCVVLAGACLGTALLKRAHLAVVLRSDAVARDTRRGAGARFTGKQTDRLGRSRAGAAIRAAIGRRRTGARRDQGQGDANPYDASDHQHAPALAKNSREGPFVGSLRIARGGPGATSSKIGFFSRCRALARIRERRCAVA
jgi:hypothetical protein